MRSGLISVSLLILLVGGLWTVETDGATAGGGCFGRSPTKSRGGTNNELLGTPGSDVLVAGGGNDTLVGFGGNDLLCGGPGHDLIFPGPGRDRVDGGSGHDFNSYNTPTARGVHASLGRRSGTGEGLDTWRGIEALTGSPGADVLLGSKRDDVILGVGGGDRIKGGPRDDLVLGMEGSDRLVGGPGRDLASFYFSNARIRARLSGRAAGEGRDHLKGFEGLEGSRRRGDVLTGDKGKNSFYGNGGDDVIRGAGGDDYVEAGRGADKAVGEGGTDRLFGQEGGDLLGATGNLEDEGTDYLIGGRYEGNDGNDKLAGGSGKDLLLGGYGNNLLNGGPGEDVVDYFGADVEVKADLAVGTDNDYFDDTYKAIEDFYGYRYADDVIGTEERNWIFGFGGPDHIEGAGGDDVLRGVGGNDEIFGDLDNDMLNGGDGTDDLDGGLGIDTCRKGENNSMCELPLPGTIVARDLPLPLSQLGPLDAGAAPVADRFDRHALATLGSVD